MPLEQQMPNPATDVSRRGRARTMSGAIESVEELDLRLSEPTPAVIELMKRIDGDLIILGAAGKMGVTLALQARRAIRQAGVDKRVVAVSRFSNKQAKAHLESAGIETFECDLLEPGEVASLPRCENVIYMAGRKFGTTEDAAATWASNTLIPAYVGRHFRKGRIVAFSTGCVYPLVTPESGGCREDHAVGPVGEYAQSCLGRERAFEYASQKWGTPLCLPRLNYAIDLRYGVLHDLAQKIITDEPVDVRMGWFNCVWQRDANAWALLALEQAACPRRVLNLTGPETLRVREVAEKLGEALGRRVSFSGVEQPKAYLNDASRAHELFGLPSVGIDPMIQWTADWVSRGGRSLGLPTHFEVRDGEF